MKQDNIYEWKSSREMMAYHLRQIDSPYRSTVHFNEFLSNNVDLETKKVIDIACGTGGATKYLANMHPKCSFLGIDINADFKKYFPKGDNQVGFEVGDIYNLEHKYVEQFDGALCLQTLSWLPEYNEALGNICDLKTEWIAMSFLGYEGKIDFKTRVEDYGHMLPDGSCSQWYYNVYSLPLMKEYLKQKGFHVFNYQKFEIDIDLEKPSNMDMGTYTVMTQEQERLQISGALLMPWYFVFAKRQEI